MKQDGGRSEVGLPGVRAIRRIGGREYVAAFKARTGRRTVSNFILTCAMAQAERTIQEHEVIRLNARDSEAFFKALSRPVRLNSKLLAALEKQAGQDIKRRISRVFVATEAGHPSTIVGYYTLSALSIELSQLPEKLARRLPRHPSPAALLGRLAVSRDVQGLGVGGMLLADALKRTLSVSDEIAIHAMVVDAIDEGAQRFHEQYGFAPLGIGSRRLFLPLRAI